MYTELIFGASLQNNTPDNVIQTIKYMVGDIEEKPELYPFFDNDRVASLLKGSSYCFGVCRSVTNFWYDDIGDQWILSSRSNVKNYQKEIQTFSQWIEDYIDIGSGKNNMYAIVIHEGSCEPTIYYLNENDS